jgi:hypothetical protein
MTRIPEPRPALQRSDDGDVQVVTARPSSLAVDPEAVARAARKKGKKRVKADDVDLTVPMPKSERKRLRRKAARHGWTAEEAASYVLRVWSES